jgi:methyl-accepting chemotaxis protein
VGKINTTSKQLDSGKQLVDNTLESINLIDASIDNVNDIINQVAANTEEQTSVTQSFTNGIMDLSKQADYLENSCQVIGIVIYDLSKKLDVLRLEMIKNKFYLTDEDIWLIYIKLTTYYGDGKYII